VCIVSNDRPMSRYRLERLHVTTTSKSEIRILRIKKRIYWTYGRRLSSRTLDNFKTQRFKNFTNFRLEVRGGEGTLAVLITGPVIEVNSS
jgi:hypothetical protein